MEWIQNNWNDVLSIIGAVILIITVVVKFTPAEKDDTVWAQGLKVRSALSLCNPDGSINKKK